MVDTAEIYKNFAHMNDIVHQSLPGGYGMGGGSRFQHAVQSWSVAGRDPSGQWYTYFMIEVDSILYASVAGTFKINSYNFTFHLVDQAQAVEPAVELVAVTPDTTQGSTSYTTSMSESFSASGGFFGADPTATIGGSVSFGHSVTRSVPDIGISNLSTTVDGQNASWTLAVGSDAPAQQAAMEFTSQMLFRVPVKPTPDAKFGLKIEFNCITWDDDNNGTAYHDSTADAMRPGLGSVVMQDWGDRGMACIQPASIVWLTSPVVPQ